MRPPGDAALERLRALVREPDLSQTRYRLEGVAGSGGMGTVYVVEDAALGRRVALKVLDFPDPGLEGRLRQEARVLGSLEHPGIVPVHEVGTLPDGRVYYTMKWVRGDRLDRHLARPSPLGDRLRLFLRIAEAVSFAHSQGVIHRDLKPENVMVGAFGEVLVLDWGLARVLREGADVGAAPRTDESAVLGTPGFMAPEQEAGQSALADARADVYSLGALLRWLAKAGPEAGGRHPGPGAPGALAAVWKKATAQAPGDRYPTVASLAADVARFLDGDAVSAYPESAARRLLRLGRRNRVALGVLAAYLAGRALIFFFTGR